MVNVWPAIAFIVASEILLRMLRAARHLHSAEGATELTAAEVPTAPATVLETTASGVLEDVPARTASPVPGNRVRAVASGRARVASVKTPEKVFAAEIERGELPSLRAIKTAMHVGTDRARVIRADLASTMQEAVPKAA